MLDLSGGRAVHARAGNRAAYQSVVSRLLPGGDGDPVALAAAYRHVVGARRGYVALLDAIAGAAPDLALLRRLSSPDGFGAPLLVDAGVRTVAEAQAIQDSGNGVVVGLETLGDLGLLSRLADTGPTMFSLDLRAGAPLVPAALARDPRARDATSLARAAAEAGITGIIVLDLARVGMGMGPDLELLTALRGAVREVELLAGGGIGPADLPGLAGAGVDAVLLATALHEGWLPAGAQSGVRDAE